MGLRRKIGFFPRQESLHSECLRRSADMHSLMAELGQLQRAQQDQLAHFALNSADDTRAARQKFEELRQQLRRHSDRVEQSVAEADRLCVLGADSLSPEQFHLLKESRQRLHSTFESLQRQTDSVLARLDLATALLLEFTSRASGFQSWVYEKGRQLDALRAESGDPNRLTESRRAFRTINEEILSRRPELSSISQLAQRIEAEMAAYVDELSGRPSGREGTPTRLQQHGQVRETAQRAQADYEALLASKQELDQLLRRLGNCSMQFEQRMAEADGWLAELERATSQATVGASGAQIESRLANLLRLNQTAIEGQPKIEAAEQAASQLEEAITHTDAHDRMQAEHAEQLGLLRRKFSTLSDRLKDGMDAARTELTQREGLVQGLRQLEEWLGQAGQRMAEQRRIPLNTGKLSELKYQDQLERGELEGKERTLAELGSLLRGPRKAGGKEDLAGSVPAELDQQFGTLDSRLRRVGSATRAGSDNLWDAVQAFEAWQREEAALAEQLAAMGDAIERLEPTDMDRAEQLGQQLTTLEAKEWAQLQQLAQRLLQIPNVEGTEQLRQKMRSHESLLRRLREALGCKLSSGHRLGERRQNFWQKAKELGEELGKVEEQIRANSAIISSEPAQRREQRHECQRLADRLAAVRDQLEALDRLGSELIQSGASKRFSMAPDEDKAEAVTRVTRQLFELRRREQEAQRALDELSGRIADFDLASQTWLADWETLNRSMEAERGRLAKLGSALSWDPTLMADSRLEAQQGAQRQRQQQPKLTQLQLKHRQLTGKGAKEEEQRMGTEAENELDGLMGQLERRWAALESDWALLDRCLGTAESVWREAQRLDKWMEAKQQLLDACTVSAVDLKLVQAQSNIAKMLHSELLDERPRWVRFNDDAAEAVRLAQSETFCTRIVASVDDLNRRWRQLELTLEGRLTALEEARGQFADFDRLQRDLRSNMRSLESSLNESASLRPGHADQKARLAEAERRLDTELRPFTVQLKSRAEAIQRLLPSDAALRSDLDDRLEGTKRAMEELGLKLASVKRAAQSASAAEEELSQELTSLLDWVQREKRQLDSLPAVSAEQNRLADQIEQFSTPYANILAREGQVIVVGSKAASVLSQSPSAELKRRLLELNEIWPPFLSAAKERHEKLERTKRTLDELLDTERDSKAALAQLRAELADAKAETEKSRAVPALESIQQRLHALGPCLDSAFALMDKLERVTEGGGAETKKHRLTLEQLRRDYSAILADCLANLELMKAKESLRARFEAEADSQQSLLDTYRTTFGLTDDNTKLDMNGNAGAVGKEALKLGLAEFDSRWSKGSRQLQSTLNRLRPNLDTKEAGHLEAHAEQLEVGAKELRNSLISLLTEFEKEENNLESLLDQCRGMVGEVAEFSDKMGALTPIGCDHKTLEAQLADCRHLDAEVDGLSGRLALLDSNWDKICADQPNLATGQAKSARLDLERAQKQLDKQRGLLEQRRQKIGETEQRLSHLDGQISDLLAGIASLSASQQLSQPPASDILALSGQQESLKQLKAGPQAQLAERRQALEAEGKELIRGAGPGVDTGKMETDLASTNAAWQSLSAAVEKRERELDAAIQSLGSIRQAQQSLLNWLDQTEELLADQLPPSADHKVVKAQLQNLDFQLKMVNDKKPSVQGFLELVAKLAAEAKDADGAQASQLKAAGEHIDSRYRDLLDGLHGRHQQLEEALQLSQQWAQAQQQLQKFLDETEKGMQAFERIPTDARRMDEQIGLQAALQEQTEAQQEAVQHFVDLSDQLCQLVAIEEGQEVDDAMRQLVTRYDLLGNRLRQYNQLMGTLAEDIATFLGSAAQMAEWLDRAEKQIRLFDDLPTEPEELGQQSEQLVELVNDISVQAQLLENVIEISRELCAHTSGSEALALQFRTDQLKQRYNQLAEEAEQKIVLWEKALPLAENLKEGQAELREHLDGVEEDMANLGQVSMDEQFNLVSQIESDLGPARDQLDAVVAIGVDLQRLTTEPRANRLAKESAELVRRFNTVADTVARKADQLRQAERQSRLTFDVLDFWIDWFNEVQDQIVRAEKPAVDMEQLRQQLRQQRQLNEEIAAERNGLREIVADAGKVARELSSTLGGSGQEGQEALLTKVDKAKKLAEDTAELGQERTAELEQAFALCKELDAEYTELNDWLEGMERELHACQPITTGMAPKSLLAQQQHNNGMLQQLQSQRPIVAKFGRNVAALSELCSETDAQNLKLIVDNVSERFDELASAFRERGDALTASLEQSSQLGDRLNMFLANLATALDQLRAQEPPSCRPPVLRRQMAEMDAISALLRQKEPSYVATRAQAQEAMQQANASGRPPPMAELPQRLEELEHRWLELNSGAQFRRQQLEALMPLAEHFWLQLDLAQQAVGQCRRQTDQLAAPAEDQMPMEQQLQQRHLQMQSLQAALADCAAVVQQTNLQGMDLSAQLNAEEEHFVQQHLAALQAQWDALLAHHGNLSTSLTSTMDQSLQFNALLQQLHTFLAEKEAQCANANLLGPAVGGEGNGGQQSPPLSVEAIREQLQQMEAIRRELDEAALRREQLGQMGAELCAQPGALGAAQQQAVRLPLAELNQRWNRLYGQLGDSQHRLERALLDMGQFAQAHAQLLAWLEKTAATLGGVDPAPAGGLKHVEIELCKLRVLLNDIGGHQPSFEAILATGRQMQRQDPQCAADTQQKMDLLGQRWAALGQQAEQLWAQLEKARAEAASRGNDLDRWQLWLDDLLAELKSSRPVGGLPETAEAQLDEFRIVKADVEQRRPQMEECLARLSAQLAEEEKPQKDDWMSNKDEKLKADWALAQDKLLEREKRLRQALEDALELARGMDQVQEWLLRAENHMALVPATSKLVPPLEEQLAVHRQFNDEVQVRCQFMKELGNKGVRMQLSCEKKDAIPMKNRLVSLRHRCDRLAQKSNERLLALAGALEESRLFFGTRGELLDWVGEQRQWLAQREAEKMGTGERIRELLDEHRRLMDQLQRRAALYEDTQLRGESLGEHAPPAEKSQIEEANEQLRQGWAELGKQALRRQHSLEEALIQSGRFEEVLAELLQWLDAKLPPLEAQTQSPNYFGDIETINALMREHFELVEQAELRKGNVRSVQERAKKILAADRGGDARELEQLAEKTARLETQWTRLEKNVGLQDQRFTAALKKAVDLSEMIHELDSTLQDIEGNVRRLGLPWEESAVLAEQAQLEKLRREFLGKQPDLERLLELARELQARAHPRAEQPLRDLIRSMGARWELLDALLNEKADKLRGRLADIQAHERKMEELLGFVEERQGQLDFMRQCQDEGRLGRLQTLMDEQQMFKADLQQRQPELEEGLKVASKRHQQLGGGNISSALHTVREEEQQSGSTSGQGKQRRDSQPHGQLSPTKRSGSKLKLADKSPSSGDLTASAPKPVPKVRRRSEQLADGWRRLWADLQQYEEQLKQRKAYLDEMERLKDFTFGEWRERYLAWNDHGKARVSDLFRRIDKSGTGMVPRKQFIDGILASKFPTTELEMGKVADEFDKGDGLISSREFMNALRFDPKKMRGRSQRTLSETERIHEEIARETARCTCAHRFPIQHISTEQDRVQYGFGFGGSMKRMVRILRSTVMVRVGGGWESLDGFLGKHDPCRAKGRINVDLLPLTGQPGSTGTTMMGEFTRRKDSSSSVASSAQQAVERLLGYSPGQPGPIMKIREKTERSVPMFKRPAPPAGASSSEAAHQHPRRGSENSIIDDIYGSSRIPRPAGGLAASRLGSDFGSNPSRPASRGSDISDFGASAGSNGGGGTGTSKIPSIRGQKGVRFVGIQGNGSGRNTPSGTGSDNP